MARRFLKSPRLASYRRPTSPPPRTRPRCPRKGSAPSAAGAALMLRPERFADHGVLVFCDIGTAGIEEIEQTSDIRVGTRGSQVLRDKLADVLGIRNAHITG